MLSKEKIDQFYNTVSSFDGFSDTEYPNLSFWDMELNQKKLNDFASSCLINDSPSKTIMWNLHKSTEQLYDEVEDMVAMLQSEHSQLNEEKYSEYTTGAFEFECRPVGFFYL